MSGSNEDEGTSVSWSPARSSLCYLFHFVLLPLFISKNQSNNFTSSPPTEVEDGGPVVTPPHDLASLGDASSNALCQGMEPLPYDEANGQSTIDGTKLLELVAATSSPRPHDDLMGDSFPNEVGGGFTPETHGSSPAAEVTSTLRPKISGGEAETKTTAQAETDPFSPPAEASQTKGTEPKDLSSEDGRPTPWNSTSMYHYHAYHPPPPWYYQHQHYYYPPPPLPSSFQPLDEGHPEASPLALSASSPVNSNLNSPLLYGRSRKRELYNRPLSAQYILDLSDYDVVCGRGGAINKVPGNIRFRRLINEYRNQYMNALKIEKPMIVRHVLDRIKPGRFLVKFSQGYLECTEERVRSCFAFS